MARSKKSEFVRIASLTALVFGMVTLSAVVTVEPATADHVGCGSVVTENTTLHADVGPCPDNGLIVEAGDVKLDLSGHTIFGTGNVGDGAGVLVRDSRGVKVTNGTVRDFDGGVVIEGGGGNHVSEIEARDNIGHSEGHPPAPGTLYGDGIAILGSSDNRIADNVTVNNGPFAGIGVYERSDSDHPSFTTAPAERNAIMNNVVEDNAFCRVDRTTGSRFCDNIGIRLEPGVGPENVVKSNEVRGNGLDGISLFADTDENTLMHNLVEGNGFDGAVPGDGIRVFGSHNQIHHNQVLGNRAGGISVGRRTGFPLGSLPDSPTGNPRAKFNDIVRNETGENEVSDLWDSNPECDENIWRRNIAKTANQDCTTRR